MKFDWSNMIFFFLLFLKSFILLQLLTVQMGALVSIFQGDNNKGNDIFLDFEGMCILFLFIKLKKLNVILQSQF